MMWIYLDNNATTQPAAEVVDAMAQMNEHLWANPSSVHRFGQMARHRVELARASIAQLIHCRARELVFTSGGTESCGLALRGVLEAAVWDARCRDVRDHQPVARLITTPVEHAAVREPAAWLAKMGVDVVSLPVQPGGWVDPVRVQQALESHAEQPIPTLVSIQWVNNETGVVQPIERIAQVIKAHHQVTLASRRRGDSRGGILLHVDATQAVGKMRVDLQAVPIDLMTLSAHKFHGPKGVGALFVRKGVRLRPQQRGGPQEQERRGGTENTPGIVGMGVAADLACDFVNNHQQIDRLRVMRDRFESTIVKAIPQAVVNAVPHGHSHPSPESDNHPLLWDRIWNTTNIGFARLEAEAILLGLSERGLCVSAGAACSSGSLEPSPVLLAMGVPEAVAHGSLRFSLSRFTTDDEVDQAIELVTTTVRRLASVIPAAG